MLKPHKETGFIFLFEKTVGTFADNIADKFKSDLIYLLLIFISAILFFFSVVGAYLAIFAAMLLSFSTHNYFAFGGWLISFIYTSYHLWHAK